jgi:4-amino-4-deoxy-L-arabinose transferase-like glycosyltransferase
VRAIRAAAFFAWFAWTAWVAAHYFAVPGELLVVLDRPIDSPQFWRTALVDALRASIGAGVVVLAAWGTGALAMRRMRHVLNAGAEHVVVVLAAGFALLSAALLTLAAAHLYRPAVVAGVSVVAALAGLTQLRGFRPEIGRAFTRENASDFVFGACAAAAIGAALVGALAPEVEYDALWYHLWLPVQWLEAGRPVDIVHEYPSLYPLSWELLNGAAMVLGGPVAARLLHFVCLPLVGATTFLLSRRLFPGTSAVLAAALAMAAPIAIWEATTAYIDLALTWYLAVSVLALLRYHESRDRRWLIVSAFLMGAAAAVKHLALVALAVVTCVLAGLEIRARRRAEPGVRTGHAFGQALAVPALFAAVSLILPAPWYLRAYAASGNPVFPDMYGLFGGWPADRWSPEAERGLQAFKDRFGTPRTAKNLLTLPWDATVHAARFGGTPGPLFLVLVPFALVGRRVRAPAAVLAAGCAAYGVIWASPGSSYQMRFVIPLLPFLAALGAEGAARVQRAARAAGRPGETLVTAIVCGLLLFNLPPVSGWHEPERDQDRGWMTHIVRGLPAAVVLGVESKEEYLARTVPSYRAWQFINTSLPSDVRILTFSGGDQLYSHRQRLWSDSTAARPATWGAAAGQERAALEALHARGITHVLFDKRLADDGEFKSLAIASRKMHSCCLERVYEDGRFALYRVRGAVEDVDPSPEGRLLDGAEARGG